MKFLKVMFWVCLFPVALIVAVLFKLAKDA